MRKILILSLMFFISFSIFGNEKIVNLKQKKKFAERKFYLQDTADNINYGYYEYNIFTKDTDDFTLDPYKGKVNMSLIRNLGIYYDLMRGGTLPWAIIGLTFGGLSLGLAAGILADSYDISKAAFYSPLDLVRGTCAAFIAIGSLLIACGAALTAIFIYGAVNYDHVKKQILNILNGEGVSMLNTQTIKFSFDVDIQYNPYYR